MVRGGPVESAALWKTAGVARILVWARPDKKRAVRRQGARLTRSGQPDERARLTRETAA